MCMVYFSARNDFALFTCSIQFQREYKTGRFSQQLHCIILFIPSTLCQASKGYRNVLNWFQERVYAIEEEEERRQIFSFKLLSEFSACQSQGKQT